MSRMHSRCISTARIRCVGVRSPWRGGAQVAAVILLSAPTVPAVALPVEAQAAAPSAAVQAPEVSTTGSDRTVGFIPFSNITQAAADEWLGAGIAETIMTDFGRVAGLSLIGHRAVTAALESLSPADGMAGGMALEAGVSAHAGSWGAGTSGWASGSGLRPASSM